MLFMFTLKVPRFLTEHAIRTFLPAGTVTFSIMAVNSGSSATAANRKKEWKDRDRLRENSIIFIKSTKTNKKTTWTIAKVYLEYYKRVCWKSKTMNANVCSHRALIIWFADKLLAGARDLKCIVFMHVGCIMSSLSLSDFAQYAHR